MQRALRRFTATETLDAGNKWLCSGCNRRVRARKQLTISLPPALLTIHLKRFSFGSYGGKLVGS